VRPNAYEAFAAACALERAAWELVKDRLPGTPGFEEGPWLEWRAAVRLSDNARRALTEVASALPASRLLRMDDEPEADTPGAGGDVSPIGPGDVVRLKSGGAPMNVRSVTDTRVMCTWFDLDGQRKVDVFALDSVELLHDLSGLDESGHPG
jgi:uncharacterized protein YodC (DUF2158 family)